MSRATSSIASGAIPATAVARLDECVSASGGERRAPSRDDVPIVSVPRERLTNFLLELRDDPALRFRLLLDVCGVDHLGEEPRFEVVYHLYSFDLNARIRVKTRCPERDPRVPSVMPLFPTANFHERETFDMYGIRFDGHPDLRRILMPDEYQYFPMRKDFPLEGIEPERVYLQLGGVMMPRPEGAEPLPGAGSATP